MSTFSAVAEQPAFVPGTERKITRTTFREWGARLPLGILKDGQLHRQLAFRDFGYKQEQQVSALKASSRGSTVSEFTAGVLGIMLTQLGPYQLDSMNEHERRLLITHAWQQDIMYAYLWLRIDAMGEEFKMNLKCPACGHDWRTHIDLLDTDVKVCETPESLTFPHKLKRRGMQVGDQVYWDLILQPPRWASMLVRESGGEVDQSLSLMHGAIRQLVGMPEGSVVPRAAMETLHKQDIELLKRTVNDNTPGPELDLESTCPNCRHEVKHGINWAWDFFFTAASL